MKIFITLFILIFANHIAAKNPVPDQFCTIKVSGCLFQGIVDLIEINHQSVIHFSETDSAIKMNFEFIDQMRNKKISVQNGMVDLEEIKNFEIVSTKDEYLLTEKKTGKIICNIKREMTGENCMLLVWLDFYVPFGKQFTCSPDDSNWAELETYKGKTFQNSAVGISFNY